MKTSNKILLSGYGLLLLCFAVFCIAAKSNMIEIDRIEGSGNITTRNLGKMTVDRIVLDDQFECILDPNSSNIIVQGDDNVIAAMENPIIENKFTSSIIYGNSYNVRTTDNPVFTIGVKDLDALTIDVYNVAQLKCLDTIKASKISINGDSNVKINLLLDSDRVTIAGEDNSNITISGKSNLSILSAEDNALVESRDLITKEWVVNMADHSSATIFASESISGNMKNSSKVHLHGKPKSNYVVNMNYSEINNY